MDSSRLNDLFGVNNPNRVIPHGFYPRCVLRSAQRSKMAIYVKSVRARGEDASDDYTYQTFLDSRRSSRLCMGRRNPKVAKRRLHDDLRKWVRWLLSPATLDEVSDKELLAVFNSVQTLQRGGR